MDLEVRTINIEVRAEKVNDKPHIKGVSPVYEAMSEDLGGWREIIHRGAFSRSINNETEILSTWNHDTGRILGNTRSGTLKLEEREDGVHFDIDPPAHAADVMESIQRGDVHSASFGMNVLRDNLQEDTDGLIVRHIFEARLRTVDPCAIPAYSQSSSEVRSKVEAMKNKPELNKTETKGAEEVVFDNSIEKMKLDLKDKE